jgi:predicted GIY-YIG superfamily endonuclease
MKKINDPWIDEWERALSCKINTFYVYTLKFKDRTAYVGISQNPENRLIQHIKRSCNSEVKKRMVLNMEYEFEIGEAIYEKSELVKETAQMQRMKKMGYSVLNSRKGGGIGYVSK